LKRRASYTFLFSRTTPVRFEFLNFLIVLNLLALWLWLKVEEGV